MKKTLTQVFCVLLFFCIGKAYSQCGMIPLSLQQRSQEASLIVEGKVIHSSGFWDYKQGSIYTLHEIAVYKVFKGTYQEEKIEIITEGGTVGNVQHNVSSSPLIHVGQTGLFMVKNSKVHFAPSMQDGKNRFDIIAAAQGFISYDLSSQHANDVFHVYPTIITDLYAAVKSVTHTNYIDVQKTDISSFAQQAGKTTATVTSFSPTTVTAGTKTKLTINGTGFGATQGNGTVGFLDANSGGAAYYTSLATNEMISWSDTKIEVYVPSRAGTGTIQVTPNGGSAATSTATLTVSYSQLNVNSSGNAYPSDHTDDNSNGGYTWQFGPSFTDANAIASFKRAFASWRCGTYVNWTIGSNTATDSAKSDGVNVICYDELPSGVLGRCTGYSSSCATGVWYISEIDIAFDPTFNWNYLVANPGGSQYDFESVAAHELGHGHQLGHVISSNEIMHYSIASGQAKRVLSAVDLNGGNFVMSQSTVANSCGQGAMIALNSGNCALGKPLPDFTASATMLCNAPYTVTFTDKSSDAPMTWEWDVDNDGKYDYNTQNPSHTYTATGTYSVKLRVGNGSGKDSLTKTAYIQVGNCPPLKCQDSLFNFKGTATLYYAGSAPDGFLTGHNKYLDKAKAEKFAYTGTNTLLTRTKIAFGVHKGSGNIVVTVWDATGSGGSPGSVLSSKTVAISSIPGTNILDVTFPTPVTISGDFFIGVQLNYAAGDTVAIITNKTSDATSNTGWEQISSGAWSHYPTNWSNITLNHWVYAIFDNRPTLSLSSNSSICAGKSVTLQVGGANTYTWAPSGSLNTSTGPLVSANPSNTTTYSVTGTSTAGCSALKTVTISVNNLPTLTTNSPSICNGSSTTVTVSGALTYLWSNGATTSSINLSPSSTTTYTVIGTSGNSCSQSTTATVTVNTCVGIQEQTEPYRLKLSPNPGNGLFVLSAPNTGDKVTLAVFNLTGQLVYTEVINGQTNIDNKQLDLRTLPPGVYLLQVFNTNYHCVQRMIIQE